LEAIVDQHPGLKKKLDPFDAQITLREVDEDIGHTLIHYLYTGQYQTLGSAALPDVERTPTEFKRSVLTYCAARLCGIGELEELTKSKIENLSKDLSIFDIQRVTEEISGKLPRHGDWFSAQVDSWAKAALSADDNLLTNSRIVDAIGRNAIFDKALMKALTEMYTELKAKVKQPFAGGGRSRTISVEQEETPSLTRTSGILGPRGKLEDEKSTGTQDLPIHVSVQASQAKKANSPYTRLQSTNQIQRAPESGAIREQLFRPNHIQENTRQCPRKIIPPSSPPALLLRRKRN
jgi:hypothetical protein